MCRKILQRLLTKIGREIQGIENINVHNNGMTIALGQCTVDETCRQQVAASEECRAASRQLALPTPGVSGGRSMMRLKREARFGYSRALEGLSIVVL